MKSKTAAVVGGWVGGGLGGGGLWVGGKGGLSLGSAAAGKRRETLAPSSSNPSGPFEGMATRPPLCLMKKCISGRSPADPCGGEVD